MHILALALCKTVGEIRRMPATEFQDWKAYYRLYPFDDVHRYHAVPSQIAAFVAAQGGVKGKGPANYRPFSYRDEVAEDLATIDAVLDGK